MPVVMRGDKGLTLITDIHAGHSSRKGTGACLLCTYTGQMRAIHSFF